LFCINALWRNYLKFLTISYYMTNEMNLLACARRTQCMAATPSVSSQDARLVAELVAARRSQIQSISTFFGEPEAVFVVEDVAIPSAAGSIAARVYTPSVDKGLPMLIYYHGGGFVAGDLDTPDTLLRALANAANCLIVSVAYRLAPENPYPAAIDDAWAALQWVTAQATKLGGHPHRMGLGGDGAGGYLAALVAQRAAQQGLSLRIQVLLCPILDAQMASDSWLKFGTRDSLVSLAQMTTNFRYFLADGLDRTSPRVSPLRTENLDGLAPALIITARFDPLRDEGEAYVQKLRAANIPVEHAHYPEMLHGFAEQAGVVYAGKIVIDQTAAALQQAFAAEAKGSSAKQRPSAPQARTQSLTRALSMLQVAS
jgi:acetyl esterase